MFEIMVSLSTNNDNRKIDEYHDSSSDSVSSSSNSSRSNGSSSSERKTIDEQYMSRVPGVPLEAFKRS